MNLRSCRVCPYVSNKNKDLYYLFPGQGKPRHLRDLVVGITVGLLAAGLIAGVLYVLQL
jgi:hypothetical protein